MSDEAQIRRENLRRLKLDPNTLVDRAGRTYSYWRDLLGSPKKSFGEKAARSIEQDLGLPRGWLDVAQPTTPDHLLPEIERETASGATLPPDLAARLAKLSQAQREAVLRSLAGLLDALEAPAEPSPLGAPIAAEHLATLQKFSDDAQARHGTQQQGHRTTRR